jgi:hypothetical protein
MWRIAEYRFAHPSSFPDQRIRSEVHDALRRYDKNACRSK